MSGKKLVSSTTFSNVPNQHDLHKHAINLFLELFGSCMLVTQDFSEFSLPTPKRINWKLLPPGRYPWSRLEEHIEARLGAVSSGTHSVIWDRQDTIRLHGPSKIFEGQGGFNDYIAYQFPEKGLVVLESIRHGNAIYVFGSDWEQFSKLTKAEVLGNNLHIDRIIHSQGWKSKLATLLSAYSAPPPTPVSGRAKALV